MDISPQGRHYRSGDGLTLFYRDFSPAAEPSGVPALCLPGLARNSRDFLDLAARLVPARRVICPDLRGRGHSAHDPDWRRYAPASYVADAWTLLDALGLARVVVIGTSLGGLMAMIMGGQQPARIAGIVLNDIGPEIAPEGLARIRGYVGTTPGAADWDEACALNRALHEQALPGLPGAQWLEHTRRGWREDARGLPRPDYDPQIGRAIRETGGGMPDPWPLFRALRCPMLVLRGARSDILSRAILERMHAEKPGLESVTVARRGHVPLLDEPESLTAIDAFLARVDRGA